MSEIEWKIVKITQNKQKIACDIMAKNTYSKTFKLD